MRESAEVVIRTDDGGAARTALNRSLTAAGFSVVEAWPGDEALRIAQNSHPDLVLLGAHLSRPEASALSRQLRAMEGGDAIAILRISADADVGAHAEALQSGADAFLAEPVDPALILATARAALSARERKRAERQTLNEAAEFERKKFAALFESMAEPILIYEPPGRAIFMNSPALELHGVRSVDEVGVGAVALSRRYELRDISGNVLPPEARPVTRVLRGEVIDLEIRAHDMVTSRRWTGIYRGGPVRNSAGEIVLGVFTIEDITERRRAEEALRERESLLRAVTDNIADCIYLKDRESRIILANPATLHALGKGAGEVLGKQCADVLPDPQAAGMILEHDRAVVESGQTQSVEEPYMTAHGTRLFLTTRTPWRDAQGNVIGLVGISRDITERKQALEQLRDSEQRFRELADSIPHAVWVMRVDGSFAYLNRRYLEYTGMSMEEACSSQTWQKTIYPEDLSRVEAAWSEMLTTGKDMALEFRMKRAGDGAYRWQMSRATAARDAAGRVATIFGTITDIHDQIVAQEALRHTSKLESIGMLAGGIAHHFNNLLVGIIGNASLAEQMLAPSDPAHDILERVVISGEHAADLTRQLLAYAGKGRFILERVNLTALVRASKALIESSVGSKVTVQCHLDRRVPTVESDPGQLQQVLMNLTLNAAEAIGEESGMVFIATGAVDVDEKFASEQGALWSLKPGRYALMEVRDTGCGIDRETVSRIFDPFYTTKFQGRGLGLAAVAGAVRSHHGAVIVESSPGSGSTFRILLPEAARLEAKGVDKRTA